VVCQQLHTRPGGFIQWWILSARSVGTTPSERPLHEQPPYQLARRVSGLRRGATGFGPPLPNDVRLQERDRHSEHRREHCLMKLVAVITSTLSV
jgi:hypothetical protein